MRYSYKDLLKYDLNNLNYYMIDWNYLSKILNNNDYYFIK